MPRIPVTPLLRGAIAFVFTMFGVSCAPDGLPEPVDAVPLVGQGACAQTRQAVVACVIDGDTFDVGACGDGGERIRVLGVDAPEVAHESAAQCWGDAAREALRERIEGQAVTLGFDADCQDGYGRTLAYVWPTDEDTGEAAATIDEWLLAQGDARLLVLGWEGQLRLQDRLVMAEATARARDLGLWAACGGGDSE